MTREDAKKILDVIRSYYIGQTSVTKNEYPKETIAGYSLVDVSNACLYGSKALEQEPCEDCISRETARRIVDSGRSRHQMIDMILATPPVTPTQRWIPVSDELPKKFGTYNVTVYDGHMYRTSYAKYQSKLKSWILTGRMSHWRVVAWQPLPQPFKAESEDKYKE